MRTFLSLLLGAVVGAVVAYWLAAETYEQRITTLETEIEANRELVASGKRMNQIANEMHLKQQVEEALMTEAELQAEKDKLDRALKYFNITRNDYES